MRDRETTTPLYDDRRDYTAYGEDIASGVGLRTQALGYSATSADSLRQKYGLTERDSATGLDHTWFRKNEGRAGRWTSPDPYSGSASVGDPQSFNRYSYVNSQPTNFVDPTGLLTLVCERWHQVYAPGDPLAGQHVPGSYRVICRLFDDGMAGPGTVQVSLPDEGIVGIGNSGTSFALGEQNRAENIAKCTMDSVYTQLRNTSDQMETARDNAFDGMWNTSLGGGIALGGGIGIAVTLETGPGTIVGGAIGAGAGFVATPMMVRSTWNSLKRDMAEKTREMARAVTDAFKECLKKANV